MSLEVASPSIGPRSQGSEYGFALRKGQFQGVKDALPLDETDSTTEDHPQIGDSGNAMIQTHRTRPLPRLGKVLSLVEASFEGFYPAYPLFDKSRFMSIFEDWDNIIDDPDRWACLNIVLALGNEFEQEHSRSPQDDVQKWNYFQTAFSLVGQLVTTYVSLWSIQALLGMAIILQGRPNEGPVSLLISASLNMAHRMGLHRQCPDTSISPAEVDERRRVFWIAYILDKDRSLRMRQPPAQDDDDMDVDLPSDFDGAVAPKSSSKLTRLSYLNIRAKLAMIQGKIYKRLYSVKANNQAIADRIAAANDLEGLLQAWRATVPIEYIQEYDGVTFLQIPTPNSLDSINSSSSSHSCEARQPMVLQLLYFNSLALVYNALPILPRYRDLNRTGEVTDYQLLSSELTYSIEARKAIELLQVTPRRTNGCLW